MASAFALIGVFLGWRPLVIVLGALCTVYAGLWWLTERSQSKFGKEHRAWREEKARAPMREEAQKAADEVREAAEKEAAHMRSLFWWSHGAR